MRMRICTNKTYSLLTNPVFNELREGLKKEEIFPKGGKGPSDLGSVSLTFLYFIFKHGPEMQRNFVNPLVTPIAFFG